MKRPSRKNFRDRKAVVSSCVKSSVCTASATESNIVRRAPARLRISLKKEDRGLGFRF